MNPSSCKSKVGEARCGSAGGSLSRARLPFLFTIQYNRPNARQMLYQARHHTLVQRPRKFLSGRWQAALAVRVLEQEVAGYYYSWHGPVQCSVTSLHWKLNLNLAFEQVAARSTSWRSSARWEVAASPDPQMPDSLQTLQNAL